MTPTPSPDRGDWHYVEGAWFDQTAVDKVVKALRSLRHTKGRFAGSPFEVEDWQLEYIISPVFGWKYPDGTRIIRTVFIEIPRKNGKSTLSAGLVVVLLVADGEMGAEVYSAATTLAQAAIVGDEVKSMVLRAPRLRRKLKPLRNLIRVPKTGSFFRVLSKVAEAAHGLNVSGAVIDELHVHKTRDLVDAIETGTGAREQPLVIIITTADEGDEFSIYAEKHDRTKKIADRIVKDPSFYGVIWAAEEDDDPFVEETWKKCNPGYGVTITKRYLEKEAEKAKTEPSYYPTFCRLHLNRRNTGRSGWFDLGTWDANNRELIVPEQLHGNEAWAGLDLSAVADLTAFKLLLPFEGEDEKGNATQGFRNLSWFWLPEDGLEDRVKREQVPYDEWVKHGFLKLTEGNVVDYRVVEKDILEALEKFDVRRLSYDRKFAGQIIQNLQEHVEVVPVSQTFEGMSAAAKAYERAVLQKMMLHGGHPVLRWNAQCVEVIRDTNDNIRPVKPDRGKSKKRIDGIVGDVMAMDGWLRAPREEDDGLPMAGGF